MPAYTEAEEDTFDYETDWKELVENEEPNRARFGDEQQEDTLTGIIPWNKRRSALRFFKGFAYADAGSPYRLHRENPHAHGDYPWLRAFDVSFRGIVLQSNPDNENGEPYDVTPFSGDLDPSDQTRRSRYTHAVTTVQYRAVRDMWFKPDSFITTAQDEWFRNTLFNPPDSVVEALTVRGGMSQLVFAEGGGGAQPQSGTTKYTAPFPELQHKVRMRLLWSYVPFEYASSEEDYFWPQKILNCVGKVSSEVFLGNISAGTLLMDPPQYTLFPWWVPSATPDEPLVGAHIMLNFTWFDPPKGITGSTYRGWNLMPWAGGENGTGGDGKYYLCTRDGTPAGPTLVPTADFRQVFTHALAP